MASPLLVAVPVTIIPAMAALWYFLNRYEGAFEDARVFFALVVGFFAGLVAIAFEFLAFPFQDAAFVAAMGEGSAFVFFVAGYAFFEAGIKVVVLGLRRFRKRRDTPYYGAAMGLGFGAMWALGFVSVNVNASKADPALAYSTWTFLAMALVPLGGILTHGASGAWVGKGSADGNLFKGWGLGTLIQAPVLLAYWFFWPSIGQGNVIVLGPAVLSLVYGILMLYVAQRKVLDHVVPPEMRDLLSKNRRRNQRRRMRDGDGNDELGNDAKP